MVTAPQIINLFLHLAIQTRHPDKKWLSSFKASKGDAKTLQWDHHGRGTWETQSHRLWCFFGTSTGDKRYWVTCFEFEFKGNRKVFSWTKHIAKMDKRIKMITWSCPVPACCPGGVDDMLWPLFGNFVRFCQQGLFKSLFDLELGPHHLRSVEVVFVSPAAPLPPTPDLRCPENVLLISKCRKEHFIANHDLDLCSKDWMVLPLQLVQLGQVPCPHLTYCPVRCRDWNQGK